MATKGFLTREQAIALVGRTAVDNVDAKNCSPTNRVGYNGKCQGDELTEWCAHVGGQDASGSDYNLRAYYYTTNEQDQKMADNDGDGSYIDWVVAGYEIV